MSAATRMTPEELLVMPDGKDFELVDGELVELEMGGMTSFVANRIAHRPTGFVDEREVGSVFGPDCGSRCFPHDRNRVRKPDVSFVSRDRLREEDLGIGWITVAPDRVVEVVSPNDNAIELEYKLEDYALAGIPVVWVIFPERAAAGVFRPERALTYLPQPVTFVGEGALEGFRCDLADVLPKRAATNGNGHS